MLRLGFVSVMVLSEVGGIGSLERVPAAPHLAQASHHVNPGAGEALSRIEGEAIDRGKGLINAGIPGGISDRQKLACAAECHIPKAAMDEVLKVGNRLREVPYHHEAMLIGP